MLYQIHTRDAPLLFKLLKGVVCVYKPNGVTDKAVRHKLLSNLCKELNELDYRQPHNVVTIEGDTTKDMKVKVCPSSADDPLIVGPRYQERDFQCRWALPLGINTSGVFLLGLNDGVRTMTALDSAHHLRTFHVHGKFGCATDTFFTDGKVTERSKFHHVSQQKIDKYLASVQAAHQKSMFELAGIDVQSQDAYELAVQGLVRPADPNVPMIYGIKCVEFKPPDFVVEIHCTNEHEIYLMSLINELGIKLHTNAVCTKLRCIRHSYFTLHSALLQKHWTIENVLNNMHENKTIIRNHQDLFSATLNRTQIENSRHKDPALA